MLLGREVLPGLKRGGDRARGYLYLSDIFGYVYPATVPEQIQRLEAEYKDSRKRRRDSTFALQKSNYAVAREGYAM